MSVPLLVLIPVALLLLVMLLCFVGCGALLDLDESRFEPGPDGDHSNRCSADPSLVAYWRLDDPALSTQVKNLKDESAYKGDVKNAVTAPALFPCPDISDPQIDPRSHSAFATGKLTLGEPGSGIVPFDTEGGVPSNPPVTCMKVDGGFISVPYDAALNPNAFTIEAWVQMDPDAIPNVHRAVVDSRNAESGNGYGFALVINSDNQWEAWLGIGSATFATVTGFAKATDQAIATKKQYYLAATFDGNKTLTLYVNGDLAKQLDITMDDMGVTGATYHPNAKQALFIGAGGPWFPERTQVQPEPPFHYPLFPFKGRIEDVGLYGKALSDMDIKAHYNSGYGCSVTL